MAEKKLDAIALLKADHDQVEDLFKQYEKASGDGRKEKLAKQICRELTIHTTIEEEIFYPACEGKVDEDLLKEAYVHIEEEEKRVEGLCSQARKAGLDMDALGEQLESRKTELLANAESGRLPEPELTTMS